MTGGDLLPMTGVWWDLNTCPVPRGFDPRNVRRSIETSFRKMFGEPRRVTICAFGNLEYVSPQVLEAISDSGIIIKHAVFGVQDLWCLLYDWSYHTPPPATILLISSNSSWFVPSVMTTGYTVLRAFPEKHRLSLEPYYKPGGPYYTPGAAEGIDWETFLKENNSEQENSKESLEDVHVYGPTWSCFICEIDTFENCSSFVNHLNSPEHKQNLFDSVAVNENGVPVHFCKLCDYPGYDDDNMDIHYNSAQHKQKEEEKLRLQGTLSGSNFDTTGGDLLPMTGVWWDLNTCPVPRGFDPRNVRRSIETSFRKMFGEPRRVTICAFGNLEYVSPQVLEAISNSGILIKHAVFGGRDMCWLTFEWSKHTPPPAKILLISSNPSWFTPTLVPSEYTVLRAFPKNYQPPPFYIPSGAECDWETLLKDNLEESLEDEYVYGPAWSCIICAIDSFESCISFVNHLKSAEHKQNSFDLVTKDKNGVPVLFCTLCDYPGIDDDNMDIHYNSAQHKQKEEEMEKKKKRIGEPSLNEANKNKK